MPITSGADKFIILPRRFRVFFGQKNVSFAILASETFYE
jgi:hypothetical protein